MLRLFTIKRFRTAFLLRGVAVWVALRLAAAWIGMSHTNPAQGVLILGVVALAVVLDARRRGEDLFLGNLGVPTSAIAAAALPGALLLELLVP